MKQEDKQLLLVDLCARLPYEVILLSQNGKVIYQTDGNTAAELLVEEGWKPYLRPMVSMTEEEKKIIADKCRFSFKGPVGGKIDLVMSVLAVDWLIDFYNKNHFDYRGLIEKGLAIAVTEENNPYKE